MSAVVCIGRPRAWKTSNSLCDRRHRCAGVTLGSAAAHVGWVQPPSPRWRQGLRGAAWMAAHNLAGVNGMSMGGAPT